MDELSSILNAGIEISVQILGPTIKSKYIHTYTF